MEKRIAQLESDSARTNEAIAGLMNRVAILQENLCEREKTSSEKDRTFSHVDVELETESLKREVEMLRAANVETDNRIDELRTLRSKMTKMILRLQRWNTSLLPASPSTSRKSPASMVETNDQMIKDLQQTIAAKERMTRLLKISFRNVGDSENEYVILTPESSDDEDGEMEGELE